jgi:TfoX/Sxy family transcriptional regulator of competence genes
MAYDEGLAQRVREAVQPLPAITERKMFGGLAFMSRGHMFMGVLANTLMARVGPDQYQRALAQPHVREMDFTGRPMTGYVLVEAEGVESDSALQSWIDRSHRFVASLPPKPAR